MAVKKEMLPKYQNALAELALGYSKKELDRQAIVEWLVESTHYGLSFPLKGRDKEIELKDWHFFMDFAHELQGVHDMFFLLYQKAKREKEEEDFVGVAEAMKLLHLSSRQSIANYVKDGKLKNYGQPGKPRYRRADILSLISGIEE